MKKLVFMPLVLLCLGSCLWGCGGGGGDTVLISQNTTATGVFVDAPVEGLSYTAGGISGSTGPGGVFSYVPGNIITFRIGDLVIGSAPGAATLTPKDLAAYAKEPDVTGAAIKIVQVLLSLNSNADPSKRLIIDQKSLFPNATGTDPVSGIPFKDINIFNLDETQLTELVVTIRPSLKNVKPPLVSAADASLHLLGSQNGVDISTHSGEYMALDSASTTSIYLIISADGAIMGSGTNLLSFKQVFLTNGNVTIPYNPKITNNVSIDVTAQQGGALLASISGKSDGMGTISATATDPLTKKSVQITFKRLQRAYASTFGIFGGNFVSSPDSSKPFNGSVAYGVDVFGNLIGWALPANGSTDTDLYDIAGSVNATGAITMNGLNQKSGARVAFDGIFSRAAFRHYSGNWSGEKGTKGTYTAYDINQPYSTKLGNYSTASK
jgi:hypothetical protein